MSNSLPQLSSSLEDYLETVFALVRDKTVARVRDIAKARGVRAAWEWRRASGSHARASHGTGRDHGPCRPTDRRSDGDGATSPRSIRRGWN